MSLGGMAKILAKLRSYHYKLIMSSFLALQIAMKIFNTRQSFIFYQLETCIKTNGNNLLSLFKILKTYFHGRFLLSLFGNPVFLPRFFLRARIV